MSLQSKPPLRRLYGDICRGYTVGSWKGETVYIKHLSQGEYGNIDSFTEGHLAAAKARGVPTREEKEEWLRETGQWSDRQEIDIKGQKDYVENLVKTKATAKYASQIENFNKQIAAERKRLNDMLAKKERLFGHTADQYAEQKAQFYYIYLSFHRDEALTTRYFTLEDLNEMDDEDSQDLFLSYLDFVEDFKLENVERISISHYFTGAFYLCGDDLSTFFARPMWQLSLYQTNLLSSGHYFRSIMQGENIPQDIRDNPEKIKEFVSASKNVKEMMAKSGKDGSNVGLVGATAKDLASQGIKDDRSAFSKDGATSLLSTLKMKS